MAVVYGWVRVPKDAGVVFRLKMWSIDEVVGIDLHQSGVLRRQRLKCLSEIFWLHSWGRSCLSRLKG